MIHTLWYLLLKKYWIQILTKVYGLSATLERIFFLQFFMVLKCIGGLKKNLISLGHYYICRVEFNLNKSRTSTVEITRGYLYHYRTQIVLSLSTTVWIIIKYHQYVATASRINKKGLHWNYPQTSLKNAQ